MISPFTVLLYTTALIIIALLVDLVLHRFWTVRAFTRTKGTVAVAGFALLIASLYQAPPGWQPQALAAITPAIAIALALACLYLFGRKA